MRPVPTFLTSFRTTYLKAKVILTTRDPDSWVYFYLIDIYILSILETQSYN